MGGFGGGNPGFESKIGRGSSTNLNQSSGAPNNDDQNNPSGATN